VGGAAGTSRLPPAIHTAVYTAVCAAVHTAVCTAVCTAVHTAVCTAVLRYCSTAVLRYCGTAVLQYCGGGNLLVPTAPPPDPAGIGRLPGQPRQGSRLAPGPQGPALPKPLSPAEHRGAKRQYVLWAPPPRLRWQFCHLKPYFVR
jgi:hypothetical protein